MPPFRVPDPVEIIAHRGFSARAPENTWAAIEAGLEVGTDAVEFDIHPASDGTPVLMHDDTVNRTTDGRGRVSAHTVEELGGLDAGSWFGSAFAGEPVPLLTAVMRALDGRCDRVYAEVKRSRDARDLERVVEAVEEANMLEATIFISMDWDALDRIRGHSDGAAIGYIVDKPRRIAAAVQRAEGDPAALLDFDARILLGDPVVAHECTERGIELACWTVNDTRDAQSLFEMGVPRITTNEVTAMVAWKTTLTSEES
jgi:glycerophosphoryl diester phosphodiesterase